MLRLNAINIGSDRVASISTTIQIESNRCPALLLRLVLFLTHELPIGRRLRVHLVYDSRVYAVVLALNIDSLVGPDRNNRPRFHSGKLSLVRYSSRDSGRWRSGKKRRSIKSTNCSR
jgi:hypothetical protein